MVTKSGFTQPPVKPKVRQGETRPKHPTQAQAPIEVRYHAAVGKTSNPGGPLDPEDLSRRLNRYLVEQKLRDARRRSREAARKDISYRKSQNLAKAEEFTSCSSLEAPSAAIESLDEDQVLSSSATRDTTNTNSAIVPIEALEYLGQLISVTSDQANLEADSMRERNKFFRPKNTQSQRAGAIGRKSRRPPSIRIHRPISIQSAVRLDIQQHRTSNLSPMQPQHARGSKTWPQSPRSPRLPGEFHWESDVPTLDEEYEAKKLKSQRQKKGQSGLRSANEWSQSDESPPVEVKRFKFWIGPLFRRSDRSKIAMIKALDQYSHEVPENQCGEEAGNETRFKHKPSSFLAIFKRQPSSGK